MFLKNKPPGQYCHRGLTKDLIKSKDEMIKIMTITGDVCGKSEIFVASTSSLSLESAWPYPPFMS